MKQSIRNGSIYLTVFTKTRSLKGLKGSPRNLKCFDHRSPLSGEEICSSRTHVACAFPAGFHVNTEPSNNVQQLNSAQPHSQNQSYLALKTQV